MLIEHWPAAMIMITTDEWKDTTMTVTSVEGTGITGATMSREGVPAGLIDTMAMIPTESGFIRRHRSFLSRRLCRA